MRKITNKSILIILTLIFSLFFSSFSKNNNKTLRGYVHVYGNEPFTYIGIETEDEKKYTIKAEKAVTDALWDTQGNLIEITGIITPNTEATKSFDMLKDGKIEVVDWKFVK